MSKYQPLADHLAARSDPEWRASFSELEALLGFPLPRAARSGRTWWANDPDKAHSRAWAGHGWEVGDVDQAAEQVVFRRGATSAAALVEAAGLEPLKESASAPPPLRRRRPEELAALAAERPEEEGRDADRARERTPGSAARALGATALVTAGLAVVAGLGAALVRSGMRRR
jgi:hypothetical protein